ncbi:MAG: phage terminase large subunit [Clostridia bacterium]|nr:phage terminase large subunit [Clostridia bacterium]MBR5278760.1 phage terminase large subunit [Clostridia bacterium]
MREIVIEPNQKQRDFFESTAKYTAYGGARGGGKSWAMRMKLILLALNYEGIQILLLRRTLAELRENHLLPMLDLLKGAAVYHAGEKEFRFSNRSRIKLGYCDSENDVLQFQGQAYEVIGLEEATHFTEFQFNALTESNRASGNMKEKFVPRMYFTCNPGGVGHEWVKRRFIDREFRGSEKPDDYRFIKSLVFDNKFIMENNPEYLDALMNLPEARRKAMLYGDWDAFEGAFFPEFDPRRHIIYGDFEIPTDAMRFRALDYGLDMTACLWCACLDDGSIIVYRELYKSNLLLSEAAEEILKATEKGEQIRYTVASPDLWNRRQESGKSGFDIMTAKGLRHLIKADNARIAGWRVVREYLKCGSSFGGEPRVKILSRCKNLVRCLPLLRFDEKVREDAAGTPHEITHAPEALRYALMSRQPKTAPPRKIFTGSIYAFDGFKKQNGGDFKDFLAY